MMISTFLMVSYVLMTVLTFLTNTISLLVLLFHKKCSKHSKDPSGIPVMILLSVHIALSLLLIFPTASFLSESGIFNKVGCDLYGASDLNLSLFQISITTFIALDRYITAVQPSWQSWRNESNYKRAFLIIFIILVLWSVIAIFVFHAYIPHSSMMFCSLDWSLSNTKKLQQSDSSMQSQRYIAFLTITFLLFFLIPLCASSALYYSVAEHIKKKQQVKSFSLNLYSNIISNNTTSHYASMSNGNNAHDGNITNNADKNDHKQKSTIAPWTPATHHISKVCLSCLLVTAVPYLPYALICLNPFDADTTRINLIAIPLLSARFSALLAPFTFIWINGLLRNSSKLRYDDKMLLLARPQPIATYQAIAAVAEVPSMSYRILTPVAPRRKLPQIPVGSIPYDLAI